MSHEIFWSITGSLGLAVTALSAYIVRCHREIKRINEDRVRILREQVQMLRTILSELDR